MDLNQDHHEYCTGGFDPDDIVISGMAGRFPECETVGELKKGLYNKKNLIVFSDARFEKGTLGIPFSSSALLKELDKFDAEFFRCANVLANRLDPAARIHMEVVYEAIADAGIDAIDMKGRRIGVFNATTADDSSKICAAEEKYLNLTSLRSMNPNRTSYALGFTGPSIGIDTACSSSGVALWSAVQSIQAGSVEAAVVSGCQLNLTPDTTLGYLVLGIMSPTGNSRPFDSKADGLMRAESVCAVFLQKAKLARRAYATVKASKFYSAGYVSEGIGVPSKNMQIEIMRDVLNDVKVSPDEIQFVEGHGTGTPVGDPIEANAMGHVFSTKTRKTPLLLGSLKSNIGHTEACSGICSVIKSLLIFENGLIPPNINYKTPNRDSPALLEGKVKVATESTPLNSDYIPVISLGFGGTLTAVLLKKNPKTYESLVSTISILPRIVLYPATTEESISTVFDYIRNNPNLPKEFFALLNKLSFTDPLYKPIRGYAIYQEGKSSIMKKKPVSFDRKQVWYVMTGMGCQWPGMGLQLMQIDEFAKSMNKSAAILKPYGVNLFELLRADRQYLYENRKITASFVTITSIQIALTDVLKLLGFTPDGIIGHSFGELAAAYADGACTHEQSLLASYIRGYAFEAANLPEGGMVAVGISWSQAQKICPKDIYPACDNADDSVTISGLKEPMEKFMKKLVEDNVPVCMVNSHGFGAHCKLVEDAFPLVIHDLKKIIPNPKPRSDHWISTSYPESQWNSADCKFCGPEYFSNNLTSCVSFTNVLKMIPSDSIILEIGPHFLLQSILRRMVGPKASYHGLMKKDYEDNMLFFLESLGRLYLEGLNPKIELLYPAVKFPVPRGTPMISDLIKWNHSQSFRVPKFSSKNNGFYREFKFDQEDAYLLDHQIDGTACFPVAGLIYLAWEALAMKHQKNFEATPIIIQDLQIQKTTISTDQNTVKFFISIHDFSGQFEITEGKSIVASGNISEAESVVFLERFSDNTDDETCLSGQNLYDELKSSGYEYGRTFRNIRECSLEGTRGLIQWQGKWITFLEAHLLFYDLRERTKRLMLPTSIEFFKIDPNVVKAYIRAKTQPNREQDIVACNFPCSYNYKTSVCRSIGVEVGHLKLEPITIVRKAKNPILEEYLFVPYVSSYTPSESSCHQLSQYYFTCFELVKKIEIALKKIVPQPQFPCSVNTNFCQDETLSSEGKYLLKILQTISNAPETFKNKKKEFLETYTINAGKDILNNTLVNEDSLKVMLGIILENTYRKLNVVEVNRNFPVVLFPVTEIVQKHAYLRFKTSYLIAAGSVLTDQDILDERGIEKRSEDSLKNLEKECLRDVAMSSFTCGPLSELRNLLHSLKLVLRPNGFILLFFKAKLNPVEELLSSLCEEELQVHSTVELDRVLQSENLMTLSKISDPFGGFLCLLRAPSLEEPQKFLLITDDNYNWVEKVKKELYGNDSGILYLVSENNPESGIIGLVNCLRQESRGERIRCVFISIKKQDKYFPSFSIEHPFFSHLIKKNLVINVWRNGAWGTYRHIYLKETKLLRPVEHSYLNCRKQGDFHSFEWIESRVKYASQENKHLIHIYYSSVNIRDVMIAKGKLPMLDQYSGNSVLGIEFSGREAGTGKRVCGLASAGSMATSILANPTLCLEVPQNWTLEEAATVPLAYAVCYYSLITRALLQPGESILIHNGSSGVGMAALTIAFSLNCEIFTTVGNCEERTYLKKKLPQIKDEAIGCSCDTSFETMILSKTNGRGVNVIFNFLSDKYQANIRCIARSGRIIQLGHQELAIEHPIHSKINRKNVAFHDVVLEDILYVDTSGKSIFQDIKGMLIEGIKNGIVQPLDRRTFCRSDIEDAFRYMTREVHIGKVLLKIREEDSKESSIPQILMLPAKPSTQFYYNKVYVIVGGLGGFGLEVVKWAIERGARNIILTSRYGARSPYQQFCLKRWKEGGLNIQVSTLNVAKRDEAEKLLQEAMQILPIGGIFNSALILKDALMDVQTPEHFKMVCGPKSEATKILDELTRKLCPDIDYFVCFSSIIAGRGNVGQTNYGYANSVMERICEKRRKDGLHGLSIQWGIIGDVGVVYRHMGDDALIAGVTAQSVKSCLQTLDVFCQQECPVVASYVVVKQSKKSVQENTLKQILNILGFEDITKINTSRRLSEIGIDSIVGTQIKQIINSYTDVDITMQDVLELKLDDIETILKKTDNDKTSSKAPPLMATVNIKLPKTLLHKDPLVVLNKEDSGEPIIMVHLKDTDVMSFQPLAKSVSRSFYALVWTHDSPSTNMESAATWYLKRIQHITDGPFYLMAISDGACLAFEMALQCERNRKKLKSLTLFSGSEILLNTLTMENAEKLETEVTVLGGFIEQFTMSDISKMKEELEKDSSLDEKIKSIYNYLAVSSNGIINKAEVSEAITNHLFKHRLIESYIPTEKISSNIHLLEDPSKFLESDASIVKELFTQLCSGEITIHRVFCSRMLSTETDVRQLATTLQKII